MDKRQRSPNEVLSALDDDDLDAEAERSAKMSDAEVDAEVERAGVDPKALRAGAGAVFERAMSRRRPPRLAYKRLPVPALAAAAVICLLVGAYVARGPSGGGESLPRSETTKPEPPSRAQSLRAEAAGQCAAGHFKACQARLDEAMAIDPEGEREANVVALRRAIAMGSADGGGRP